MKAAKWISDSSIQDWWNGLLKEENETKSIEQISNLWSQNADYQTFFHYVLHKIHLQFSSMKSKTQLSRICLN